MYKFPSDELIMTPAAANAVTAEPVLILIHGATCNGKMWDAVRRHLAPQYRVIAPDLPGHGSRRNEAFTLEGAISTVTAAAREVAPSPVVLVGDSLGGYTSLAAASALPPEQLKGLVLGGCSTNLTGTALLPFLAKTAMFKILLALFGEPRLIRKTIPKLINEIGMSEKDVNAMVEQGISLSVFEQAVNALRGIDFRQKLAAVVQPVLIVNGSRDKVMVNQEASFLAVARQAQSHRFENCEHGVSILRSPEFAGLVNVFAARVFATEAGAARPN
jgi:pimeloyl-ACP methyl ester carboxylesterase